MAGKRLNLLIGIPMERTISSTAAQAFIRIAGQGHNFALHPYAPTDLVRNRMCKAAVENKDITHLLMIDSDETPPPNIVQRMCRWLRLDPEPDVIGAVVFRRGPPYEPCVYVKDLDTAMQALNQWRVGLVPVEAIGTGCILIARRVLETLEEPWFMWGVREDRDFVGHDIRFSRNARAAGFTVWCDTDTIVDHLIESVVNEEKFVKYAREQARIQKETGKADYRFTIEELPASEVGKKQLPVAAAAS